MLLSVLNTFYSSFSPPIFKCFKPVNMNTCSAVALLPVKTTILNYQSPTTGLFPIKTCSTCKEAKVRDSLYCAAGAWALAVAYRSVQRT